MKLTQDLLRDLVCEVKATVSILHIAEEAGIRLKQEGSCYKGLCPFHDDDATASLALYEEKGRWHCFGACQSGGDLVDFYRQLHGRSFVDAVRDLAEKRGLTMPRNESSHKLRPKALANKNRREFEIPPPPAAPKDLSRLKQLWPYDRAEEVYVYPIAGGGEAHEVRYLDQGKKKSVLCRPSAWGLIYGLTEGEYYRSKNVWRKVHRKTPPDAERKLLAAARVGLYRPEVFGQAVPGQDWIFCVEGPKDAETAIQLGLYATTSICGASGLRKDQAEELRDHRVAVLGDHDAAGEKGAERRAKRLRTAAREVRVLPPLGGEPGSGYDLSDFVADRRREGASRDEMVKALRDLLRGAPSLPGPKSEIEVTTREKEVNDAALAVLVRSEKNLFQRFGALVHVVREDGKRTNSVLRPRGAPAIRVIPDGKMRETLAEHCRFVKISHRFDREVKMDLHPPQWVTRALLARGEWPSVEKLERVVEGPALREDGSVLQEPGFDASSGLLYLPNADYEKVPESPQPHEVQRALELLKETVCDFPFRAETHFSAWLSALLTPLARFAFAGPAPLNLIDANTRGAGKSLLADVCNMIVTGRPAARMSYNRRDESELRKAVTSLAMNGDQIVLIDNIRGAFGDATLDRALTATLWKDRLLGSNLAVDLPLDVTWFATGNNITLTADTPRRCLHIRLESPEEHPDQRTEFRHPNLLAWISRERRRILPAALTLLRAWWAAGRPKRDLSGLGSYEGWSETVRQCVVWLGLPDPAETRVDLEEAADVEGAAVSSLVLGLEDLLQERHLDGEGTASEILTTLKNADAEAFPDLRYALAELIPKFRAGDLPSPRQLGYLLRQHRGKYVSGACLTVARERSKNGTVWSVRRREGRRRPPWDEDRKPAEPRRSSSGSERASPPDPSKGVDGADGVDVSPYMEMRPPREARVSDDPKTSSPSTPSTPTSSRNPSGRAEGADGVDVSLCAEIRPPGERESFLHLSTTSAPSTPSTPDDPPEGRASTEVEELPKVKEPAHLELPSPVAEGPEELEEPPETEISSEIEESWSWDEESAMEVEPEPWTWDESDLEEFLRAESEPWSEGSDPDEDDLALWDLGGASEVEECFRVAAGDESAWDGDSEIESRDADDGEPEI